MPSRNQEKRTRVMTDAENVANVLAQNGKLPQENLGRFNTMKKVAEEQRRKVRETRYLTDSRRLANRARFHNDGLGLDYASCQAKDCIKIGITSLTYDDVPLAIICLQQGLTSNVG